MDNLVEELREPLTAGMFLNLAALVDGLQKQRKLAADRIEADAKRIDELEKDLDAHIGAVLEEAAGLCRILEEIPQLRAIGSTIHYDLADDIRTMRPDATQALERKLREARVEGMCKMADALDDVIDEASCIGFGEIRKNIADLIAAEERGENGQ